MTDLWRIPLPKLVDKADAEWSHYIRLRDSSMDEDGNWWGACITCTGLILVRDSDGHWKSSAQCGHYLTREHMSTRYLDTNTHLQCEFCNTVWDKREMLQAYEDALVERYGAGIIDELNRTKNIHGLQKFGRPQIIEAIDYAKRSVSDMLST